MKMASYWLCTECGKGIIANGPETVECPSCHTTFVKHNPSSNPSSPQFDWPWLIGAFILGFIIGWPVSRGLLAATARVSIEELERRVEEWGAERR